MRVLFDQGVPVPLRNSIAGNFVATAYENNWQELRNGDLLDKAEQAGFDVFVTTDQNLKYQQALSKRHISIIVLRTTSWHKIKKQTNLVVAALERTKKNSFEEIFFIN